MWNGTQSKIEEANRSLDCEDGAGDVVNTLTID